MPKVSIVFTLPDEQEEYRLTNDALKMHTVIWEFTQYLRTKTKYGDGKDVSWETVREDWWKLLQEEGVDPHA